MQAVREAEVRTGKRHTDRYFHVTCVDAPLPRAVAVEGFSDLTPPQQTTLMQLVAAASHLRARPAPAPVSRASTPVPRRAQTPAPDAMEVDARGPAVVSVPVSDGALPSAPPVGARARHGHAASAKT